MRETEPATESLPVLTDDEVLGMLAIAGAERRPYVPTVTTSDSESLAAATLRGERSLGVRRLVGSDGALPPALRQLTDDLTASGPRLVLYLGDQRFRKTSDLLSVVWRKTPTGWLKHDTSPIGTHVFAYVTDAELEASVGDLFAPGELAVSALDVQPPVGLCVVLVDERGVRGVATAGDSHLHVAGSSVDDYVVTHADGPAWDRLVSTIQAMSEI